MWAFPWLTWAALVAMGGVLVLMLTDATARPQLLWSAGATAAVLLVAGGAGTAGPPPRRPLSRHGAGTSHRVATDDASDTHGDDHV